MADITYRDGDFIELKPGFEVAGGSDFLVEIIGCTGGNCLTQLAGTSPPGGILNGVALDDVIRVPVLCYITSINEPFKPMLWDDNLVECDGGVGFTLWDNGGDREDFLYCSTRQQFLVNYAIDTCFVVIYYDNAGTQRGIYPKDVTSGLVVVTPTCLESLQNGEFIP